jgi:hypothetical protein
MAAQERGVDLIQEQVRRAGELAFRQISHMMQVQSTPADKMKPTRGSLTLRDIKNMVTGR